MEDIVICFRSSEEDTKTPGSFTDSSGYHVTLKSVSDLGPGNCTL